MTRDELIDAGVQAVVEQNYLGNDPEAIGLIREDVTAAFDTIEPLIRADERGRADVEYAVDWQHRQDYLRAKVEALPLYAAASDDALWCCLLADVIALLDGSE